MASRVVLSLSLVSLLAASTGAALAAPGEMIERPATQAELRRMADAGPVPSVWFEPYDPTSELPSFAHAAGADPARRWDPVNWRINSDMTTEVQNEEQVVVNPTDPENLVAIWRDFRLGYRRVGVAYSFDGGFTWTDSLMDEPTYPRHSDPGLTTDRFGGIYAVILSYTGNTSEPNGLFVAKSEDGGVTWGPFVPVVNGVPGVFEDKELIACDRTGGVHDGNLYVTWARFWSTLIMSSRSTDGGASFQSPVQVSDLGGVQWPVPAVGPDGTVYIAWVHYSPAQIRLDRSYDGGATFGNDTIVTDTDTGSLDINGGVRVFCFPAMECDITGGTFNGRLYIAYMDEGFGDYDIFLRYSDDHGETWSSPLRVNDDFLGNGADQFHPWTVVSPDGVVNIIFYDRRHDPSNLLMDLYLAQSLDGGQSFEPNVRLTSVSSDPTAGSERAGLIGEYIGLAAISADRVVPVWTDTRLGNQDAFTTVYDPTFAGVPDGMQAARLSLAAPRPNPATLDSRLAFAAPGADDVAAEIYDVSGRLVRSLSARAGADGAGEITWDGADASGRPVASGVYFLRASVEAAGSAEATAKIVVLR